MTDEDFDKEVAEAYASLEEIKEISAESGIDYVEVLEDYYVCAMVNWEACLQEVEELRAFKAAHESAPALTTQGDHADHTLPEERR